MKFCPCMRITITQVMIAAGAMGISICGNQMPLYGQTVLSSGNKHSLLKQELRRYSYDPSFPEEQGRTSPASDRLDSRIAWLRQFGTPRRDIANSLAVDSQRNVYVGGEAGQLTNSRAWLTRLTPGGRLLWRKQLPRYESVEDIAVNLRNNNLYLTGNAADATRDYQAWVALYRSSGIQRWSRRLDSPNDDFSFGAAVDSRGNVYVTGYTQGKLGAQNFGGGADAWIAKFNSAGRQLWIRQFGSNSLDFAFGAATNARGDIYVTGYTFGRLGGQNFGNGDAWLAKFSSVGKRLWIRQLGSSGIDFSWGVATDNQGFVYATGSTDGRLGRRRYGRIDAWVAKYSPAGRRQWIQQLGSRQDDLSLGIAIGDRRRVYITGMTSGRLGRQRFGRSDGWMAMYSGAGQQRWISQLGSVQVDSAEDIVTDNRGSAYVAGTTKGKLGQRAFGNEDAWVAKYR